MVERRTVNSDVPGSRPGGAARRKRLKINLNKIFFSSNFFDINSNLKEDQVIKELFLHCKSKFNFEFDISVINEQTDGEGISVIVVTEYDTDIFFKENVNILRFPNEFTISAKPGDIISFHSSNKFAATKDIKLYNFSYKKQNDLHGNGSKVFEVTATLRDEYKIKIKADTYEDAIKQAYSINLMEWYHVDINTNLPSIQINRYTKWGMLDATEI